MSKETTVKKPVSLQLIGPAFPIWNELAVHLRDSYVIDPNLGIEIASNGNAIVNLVLGNPDSSAIERAKESTDLAVQLERAAYEKAVREEAKRLLEQDKRDQLNKQVSAIKAEQAKQIRALEKATEVAIASLK
jgi:hypothetical protein